MPIYLISGVSGSGKTTIRRELRSRGLATIDTDADRELSGWSKRATGVRITDPPAYPLSAEWLREHEWSWNRTRMEELLAQNDAGPLFMCGGASNEREFFPRFTKMFVLLIGNEALAMRLQAREPERWISNSAELDRLLRYNAYFTTYSQQMGMLPIDSNRPPAQVADDILEIVRNG